MKIEVTPEDVLESAKWLEGSPFERSMLKARLKELTPEERLEGLDAEAIEAYLEKIKRN